MYAKIIEIAQSLKIAKKVMFAKIAKITKIAHDCQDCLKSRFRQDWLVRQNCHDSQDGHDW